MALLTHPPDTRAHTIRNWAGVVLLAIIALLLFAKIGEEVFERETTGFDAAVRRWVLAHQLPAVATAFHWISTIGSVSPLVGVAIFAAAILWYRGRPFVASTVLFAPAVAVAAYLLLKNMFARSRPSGLGNILEGTYSFPSAHATSSSAICCTLAYVFWRERLVSGVAATLFAVLVPLFVGMSRVYLDVHWATDVLGGWSAGVLIAALSAALYNSSRHVSSFRRPVGAAHD